MTHCPWRAWAGLAGALLLTTSALPASAACTDQAVPWVAGEPAGKRLPLRKASGLGPPQSLAVDEAPGILPGTLLRISRSGNDCTGPLNKPVQVVGGALAGRVESVGDKGSTLSLLAHAPGTPIPPDGTPPAEDSALRLVLTVAETARDKAAALRPGDLVRLRYSCNPDCPDGPDTQAAVTGLGLQDVRPGAAAISVALAGSGLLLVLLAAFIVGGRPWRLAVGQDRRYSTSKFQLMLWFWVVVSGYLATNVLRVQAGGLAFLGGVDIPANLLVLSGISVLSFATAKLITTSKIDAAGALAPDPKPPARDARVADLVTDDARQLDLGDFQIVLLTLVAVAMYLGELAHSLGHIGLQQTMTLPDLDTTLLSLLGLGHAGYLGKKAAGEAGAGTTPPQAAAQTQQRLLALRQQHALLSAAAKRTEDLKNDTNGSAQQAQGAADKPAARAAADAASATAKAAVADAATAAGCAALVASEADAIAQLRATWSQHADLGPVLAAASAEAERLRLDTQTLADQASTNTATAQADMQAARQAAARFG